MNLTKQKNGLSRRVVSIALAMAMCASMTQALISGATTVSAATASATTEDYTQYVDPFVGTDVDYGQQFPGAMVPYGLVKLSPDTYPHVTDDHAGYDYSKDRIAGFSHTRVEGVGGQGAGGDILVTPTYVTFNQRPLAVSMGQKYTHPKESASPGYYSVELTPKKGTQVGTSGTVDSTTGKNILAEMTTDTRTGYHRYTLPEAGKFSLAVDMNYTYHGTDIRNALLKVENSATTTALSGRFSGKNVTGSGKYTLYYYAETSKPAASFKTWNGSAMGTQTSLLGNDLGAILTFDGTENEKIELKVSISPISAEQAKIDMHNEIPNWNFDQVKANAKQKWNDVLSKVKVENSTTSDPDGRLKKLFYTHLYRMFMTPVNATSTSNTFRATDGNVYQANDYTHYDSWTLWDDFRKYPMIGLVMPETYKDIIRSLSNLMEYGIATWSTNNQTVPNVRTEHAVALLADGVAKGFTDIDNLQAAYAKAKSIANSNWGSDELKGYSVGRVDKTVENSYDDWAVSLLSKTLGNTPDYEKYIKRSFFYKNLFKADAVKNATGTGLTYGLLWPKDANGNWMAADPEQYGNNGLYQGTLWQYTW
ncbi:MAG: carbohydrate-binding protein, partial [Oscillospiraceae bacterium]|nr:carbohydrate-binding protein [Oscillospiraceae bacterium]